MLDSNGHWTIENNFDGSFVHWADHAMFAGETESRMNEVDNLTLHDNPTYNTTGIS